jgi:hypothetical protein
MGMSPAPPNANLFVGISDEENVADKSDYYINSLKQFIDDDIGM